MQQQQQQQKHIRITEHKYFHFFTYITNLCGNLCHVKLQEQMSFQIM